MNTLKKYVVFFSVIFLYFSPLAAMFVGAQHWKNEKTGKEVYLFFETHNLGNKDHRVAQTIVDMAKKMGAKILTESLYTEMKQCIEMIDSLLPLIHHLCIQKKVPVEDVDVRGAYEGKCREIDLSILIKRCEIAIDNFNTLRIEIEKSDDPKTAKKYYRKIIKNIFKNPFFVLINNTITKLKKEKNNFDEKNLNELYEKTGKTFSRLYLDLVKKNFDYRFRTRNSSLLENIDKNLSKLTGPIFRRILNNEFLPLLDLRAMRSILEAHKKYDIIFLCAGSKHCYSVAEFLKKLYGQTFLFKSKENGLIKEIGATHKKENVYKTDIYKIDINKIFKK